MALKPVLLLLLWNLTLLVHGVTSSCNVTCSTDYSVSLNCSCSGSVPTESVLLQVKCSDEELEVDGACEVKPPSSWCIMSPENLYEVASIGTMCTATVSQRGGRVIMNSSESSTWALSDVVKPQPPFDVQVTSSGGQFNISWDHDNHVDCLMYRVRIRQGGNSSEDSVPFLMSQEKCVMFHHKSLQSHTRYTVDVQAKLCPGILYEGPWSEWSPTAEWRTAGPNATEGIYRAFFVFPAILAVFALMFVACLKKTYLQRKFQLIAYVPKPDDFFKPLYNSYGGDFKEWVRPAFSEYDYLRVIPQDQMKSEKQHDIVQWNNEKQGIMEDNKTSQGGHHLHMLQPQSNSLLFFQDGGSSDGTGHSTGHISIHTVTLSGEEEFEEEVLSQSSVNTLRSYQDGENFGSFGEENGERAGYDLEEPQMSGLERLNGELHQENQISDALSVENVNFHPRVHLNEPERVSLDSFASNEQSEDGYPHVDLDTIDSGFGECGSPGASDSNTAEQIDSDSFTEHKSANSNYVKQWMICSTITASSNSENELCETQ